LICSITQFLFVCHSIYTRDIFDYPSFSENRVEKNKSSVVTR